MMTMTESEKALTTFQTRIRDLIHRFQELKKENEELYAMVQKNDEDIQKLYADFLGEPGSEKAHHLLHTTYHNK